VSCDPERVTAYVDRELTPWLERAVERHLAGCPACAAQAAFEIELAETLGGLPAPRLRVGFAARVLAAALTERPSASC
jgi:anti-sigma factor RsiW